jgi:protease-4
MNSTEKDVMQLNIEQIYGEFVGKVAMGRKMEASQVDSIGQGRVWSGSSAIGIGLVDEMGGLSTAIKGAAELAGLSEYSIKELPVVEDPYLKLLSQLGGELKMRMLRKDLGEYSRYYNILNEISEMTGVQARLPYFIDIH